MLIPGVVAGITIVIFAILAVFTCTYRKSFLSGRAFSSGEGAIIRVAFLFSAGVVLTASIMFLTLGGNSFTNAFDDFEGSKEVSACILSTHETIHVMLISIISYLYFSLGSV